MTNEDVSIGIKHYATKTMGIGGVIKRRICDFVVREITLRNRVLQNKCFGDWVEKRDQPLVVPPNDGNKEYLHLTMEKFGVDTNTALRKIARALQVSQKRIGYAGLKDRRAITVQRISIWKPNVEKLSGFKSRYVCLSEPEWSAGRIEIGGLKGNEFEITIRNIGLSEQELKDRTMACLREIEEYGVFNYFGEQRFGGVRRITHRVGKEFVKGNIREAVMLYLTAPSREEEEIARARKNLFETRDFVRAIKEYPKKFRYERSIIHHLCKYPNDFVGAFQKLPKHLAYLFTHAYQSYLFNCLINERIESGVGLNPIEGDVLEEGVVTLPLLGFDSKLSDGKAGEIEKRVLEREGIKLEDFRVKSYPELSCKGSRKKALVKTKNASIVEIKEDEFYEGKLKIKIKFSLEKGNYATTILRELMKNE